MPTQGQTVIQSYKMTKILWAYQYGIGRTDSATCDALERFLDKWGVQQVLSAIKTISQAGHGNLYTLAMLLEYQESEGIIHEVLHDHEG